MYTLSPWRHAAFIESATAGTIKTACASSMTSVKSLRSICTSISRRSTRPLRPAASCSRSLAPSPSSSAVCGQAADQCGAKKGRRAREATRTSPHIPRDRKADPGHAAGQEGHAGDRQRGRRRQRHGIADCPGNASRAPFRGRKRGRLKR
jgi:hypothetical protein